MKRISLRQVPYRLLIVAGVALLLAACTASAPNPESGDSGCICPAGYQCSPDGTQCLVCAASCSGKQCGDDGCGGSCGGCGLYAQCGPQGLCQPTCELLPLQVDTTVDFNLQVYRVTAAVTRNGAPLPDDAQERGSLVFREQHTGRSIPASLGSTGPAVVDTQLMAGTYTVLIDSTGPQSVLPRQQTVLRDEFVVDKDSTLSADLQVVSVRGSVMLNGQALPDDVSSRGQLRFRPTTGGLAAAVDLGASGPGSYLAQLYSGSYDILVDSTNPGQTALPQQQVQLYAAQKLTADQKLDLALKTLVFAGEVTRHHAPMPDSPTDRGSVSLARSEGGPPLLLAVPRTGPGRFSGAVYAGSYEISFDSTISQTVLPRQVVPLASRVLLTRDKTTDFDLQVATLNGLLKRDGSQLPDDPNPRGEIVLVRTDNHAQARTPLPSHGPALYSLEVYRGNYNVLLDSSGSQSVLPQMITLVQQNLAVTTDQRLDIPLHLARLTGRVTLDGADLPLSPSSLGDLVLLDRKTGAKLRTAVPGNSGGNYSLTVYPGSYYLQFDSSSATQTMLPHLVAALGRQEVSADARIEVPLMTVAISGAVQKNGATMPDEPSGQSRGNVSFVNKLTGSPVSLDVLGTGAARYATTLYSGSYNVFFDATGLQSVLPPQQIQLRNGCVPP